SNPSRPAPAKKAQSGSKPSSSTAPPRSRSGVTAAASAPRIMAATLRGGTSLDAPNGSAGRMARRRGDPLRGCASGLEERCEPPSIAPELHEPHTRDRDHEARAHAHHGIAPVEPGTRVHH